MSHPPRVLLVFESIHHVLAAEAALKAAAIPADLIPVPREIDPNCGMAVTLAPADRARALALLEPAGLLRILDDWQA